MADSNFYPIGYQCIVFNLQGVASAFLTAHNTQVPQDLRPKAPSHRGGITPAIKPAMRLITLCPNLLII